MYYYSHRHKARVSQMAEQHRRRLQLEQLKRISQVTLLTILALGIIFWAE